MANPTTEKTPKKKAAKKSGPETAEERAQKKLSELSVEASYWVADALGVKGLSLVIYRHAYKNAWFLLKMVSAFYAITVLVFMLMYEGIEYRYFSVDMRTGQTQEMIPSATPNFTDPQVRAFAERIVTEINSMDYLGAPNHIQRATETYFTSAGGANYRQLWVDPDSSGTSRLDRYSQSETIINTRINNNTSGADITNAGEIQHDGYSTQAWQLEVPVVVELTQAGRGSVTRNTGTIRILLVEVPPRDSHFGARIHQWSEFVE